MNSILLCIEPLQNRPMPVLTIFSLIFIFSLVSCGKHQDPSDVIDEIESRQPDKDLSDQDPEVCLGRVMTDTSNLNIRTSPEIDDNICGSLPPQSYVTLLNTSPDNGFYLVVTDFCESENQYVATNYIELSDNCGTQTPSPLPPPLPPNPIENLGDYIEKNIEKVSVVRELIRGGAKGRVNVHKVPGSGEESLCGSKHIRSYRSEPYLGIETLCAWTAVAQEWRTRYCPNNNPHCRIMVGDQSFGKRLPSSWPHSTHRRGWCMDIWPMRNPGCGEQEITWKQRCYSRSRTRNLVNLLVKHGADKGNQLFFNDPQIPHVRPLRNHDDHIHVCFKPSNSTVKTKCDVTKVDQQICSEFFNETSDHQIRFTNL